MKATPLYLSGLGLACPLGLSALSACAAIRARMNRFRESRYLDNQGQPIVCSELQQIPAELPYPERTLRLLSLAIGDAVKEVSPAQLERMPLLVGGSEPTRPGSGFHEGVVPRTLDRLREQQGVQLEPSNSRSFPSGSTGGFRALAEARRLLEHDGRLPGCVVAGVDSLVNAPALAWLLRHERLKRPGNSDGVIPGEAAACIVVTRKPLEQMLPVTIAGLGFAQEAATLQAEEPLRGNGLSSAYRGALAEAGLGMEDIDLRLTVAAGEGYAFKETALAMARLLRVRKEKMPLWLPAESLGETGAAAALVALIMAAVAMRRGYAPGDRALAAASSDSGDRAAVVLRAQRVRRTSES